MKLLHTRKVSTDVVFTVNLELEAQSLQDLADNARANESWVIELGEIAEPMQFSG